MDRIEDDILRALRRITRAIDLHSRKLASTFGLTGPQLICLRAVRDLGETTPSVLAKEVSLSQGTITGIIDRLVARQLVCRERSEKDRRIVTVSVTPAGRAVIEQAPYPLQEQFVAKLTKLTVLDQHAIRDTLNRVVEMMGGEEIEAAPVLTTSPAAQSTEEVRDVIDAGVNDVSISSTAIAPALQDALSEDE